MLAAFLLQITQAGQAVADTVNSIAGQMNGEQTEITLSLWDLAMKGGWILAILAVFSIIAIYIFIERFFAINRGSKEEKNFMNNIRDFIHDGRIDSAVTLCKNNESPIARMIEKGLARIGKPLNDINAAIENVGKLEVSKLEKNIAGLATIAGAGPML
ncbi:MAG: MotA/TolQ/ExbB proton channel family protein, partial [Bacteroidales bacterium]|nr:MotA/TolQ/ExbB proton channel family protein [Bacteroidales bacterium]